MESWKELEFAGRDFLIESSSKSSNRDMSFLHQMLFLRGSWMPREHVKKWLVFVRFCLFYNHINFFLRER